MGTGDKLVNFKTETLPAMVMADELHLCQRVLGVLCDSTPGSGPYSFASIMLYERSS